MPRPQRYATAQKAEWHNWDIISIFERAKGCRWREGGAPRSEFDIIMIAGGNHTYIQKPLPYSSVF